MPSINLLDENLQLWNEFRNGNADAFAALMRTHYQDLFDYGTRFTKDEELVKDCIQDLFLSLWAHRLTISETSFVKYYLLKSLRHSLVRAIERSRHYNHPGEGHFIGMFNGAAAVNDILREEHLADLAAKMRKVLAGLTRRQQEVIYLRFYMEADIEEIGEIMGLNRQSVYNLLHDSFRKLRKATPKKAFWFPHILPLLF